MRILAFLQEERVNETNEQHSPVIPAFYHTELKVAAKLRKLWFRNSRSILLLIRYTPLDKAEI
jgi:hypothetical protein